MRAHEWFTTTSQKVVDASPLAVSKNEGHTDSISVLEILSTKFSDTSSDDEERLTRRLAAEVDARLPSSTFSRKVIGSRRQKRRRLH